MATRLLDSLVCTWVGTRQLEHALSLRRPDRTGHRVTSAVVAESPALTGRLTCRLTKREVVTDAVGMGALRNSCVPPNEWVKLTRNRPLAYPRQHRPRSLPNEALGSPLLNLLIHNMTPETAVVTSMEISASTNDAWRALTEPDKIAQWMGGARVESKWELGGDITFTGKLHRKTYRDRGTVLAIEPAKLLKYSHWTKLSRLPDVPENRTVITFSLDWTGEKTRLTVRHERFYSEAAYKHSNFFWGFALTDVKNLLER